MKEIIYIGGNGKLATYIETNTNYIVSKRDRDSQYYLDLNSISESNLIKRKNCLFIIGAAISEPTKCEGNPDFCRDINLFKTAKLIEILLRENKVLFLSSDLVFEGNDMSTPNSEKTKTNPIHLYSKFKVAIEEKFLPNNNFFIARLSYLLFKENSFTNYLKHCLENNHVPEIIHPLTRHATGPDMIVQYMEELAREEISFPKIKHIAGNALSRLEMYFNWCEENNIKPQYKTINIDETSMKEYPSYINFKSIYN